MIVISEFVSLDGVMEDPAAWVGAIPGREEADVKLDEALGAEALLLGRRTYEFFAARWPSRDGELADRLNGLPKYVVSSGIEDLGWGTTTVITVDEIGALRQELHGEIVVYGSLQLVRTLMEHDLVDELRLMIYPVVLGAGERLFDSTGEKRPLRLVDARTVGEGVALLTYESMPAPARHNL